MSKYWFGFLKLRRKIKEKDSEILRLTTEVTVLRDDLDETVSLLHGTAKLLHDSRKSSAHSPLFSMALGGTHYSVGRLGFIHITPSGGSTEQATLVTMDAVPDKGHQAYLRTIYELIISSEQEHA
jgi:hypothetical protein